MTLIVNSLGGPSTNIDETASTTINNDHRLKLDTHSHTNEIAIMAINNRIAIVPPLPGHGYVDVNWNDGERRIGLPLPHGYEDYTARYGVGTFDEFVHVCPPTTNNENLGLASRRKMDIDALRELQSESEEEIPYRAADPPELLPVKVTTNGDISLS